ncbi:hypothetical protein K439DRAFT_1559087 [Ramaria rubella]|nr:hypothetical protein K439DRAFT_1559087 [Ramaria rubella]
MVAWSCNDKFYGPSPPPFMSTLSFSSYYNHFYVLCRHLNALPPGVPPKFANTVFQIWFEDCEMHAHARVQVEEFHDVFTAEHEHHDYGLLLQCMKVVSTSGESQMDKDQWDAANNYLTFAFEKR